MMTKWALCTAVLLLSPAGESLPQSKEVAYSKPFDLLPIETNIIKYTNDQRAKYALAALEVDPELMKTARGHASWMARNRSLVHTSRAVAGNIAMGQSHSREAVRNWMNSSGHRANILGGSHRRIGVAAYRTPGGTIYWCQQFRR